MNHAQALSTLGPPVCLILEISNPTAAQNASFVALGTPGGGLIDHEPLSPLAGGRDDLHPAIERLCARAGVTPDRIGRVAVSVGPGGYTGLRVAVAAGALIAEATGAETVAVPTARLVGASVAEPAGAGGGFPRGIALASKGDACHLTIQNGPDAFADSGLLRADRLGGLGLCSLVADAHLPRPIAAEADRLGIPVVAVSFSPEAACRLAAELPPTDTLAVRYAREPDAVTQWRARRSD